MFFKTEIDRVIDANRNRCIEGLRVVEDYLRFIRNDSINASAIRDIRHEISKILDFDIVGARDVNSDIGKNNLHNSYTRIDQVLRANLSRTKESLRVLEEFTRYIDTSISDRIMNIRFRFYEVEKRLLSNKDLEKIYILADVGLVESESDLFDGLKILLDNNVRIVQLRAKKFSTKKLYELGLKIIEFFPHLKLIINDKVEVALALKSYGVHVGEDELPFDVVRDLMRNNVVGATVHNVEDLRLSQIAGVDYIGVGAIYPSTTKPDCQLNGIEFLKKIRALTTTFIYAIGGINSKNAKEVFNAGADGICVGSGFWHAKDRIEEIKRLIHISSEEEN
ncbi:Thiamine-phosphate pyrophosphorylase [Thermodesulfobium narugense DSM 14796]|uniref:Thiamine-phosphate synthase n=1 Tax=Thermodesulfobium narugense DSM 14796 TaxID=747365 RepID=M1E5A0_9BACT|nr:thiamine phosphate synthase [Thermodesulfobium narugense]AEE14136.1 Thiamine-phosphate pyrophosphorylase [Thermodesulfobium narugense DSM 14796]